MTANAPGLPRKVGGYRILRLLGEGGTGVVYLALRSGAHHPVALKVLRIEAEGEGFERRFRTEAEHLKRLHHPGIAALLDAGTAPLVSAAGTTEVPFLALEFVDGLSLLAHAERNGLDTAERLELCARTCDAVQHAHDAGVVHRDLKPANVLVVPGEDRIGRPKVLDFGVARAVDHDGRGSTLTGSLVGTVPYMSPEQVLSIGRIDGRSDVYSLGVVLYQLVTGRMPYDVQGRPLPEAARAIQTSDPEPLGLDGTFGDRLTRVVAQALEKSPRDRYASPGELAADLRACAEGRPVQARAPGLVGRARRFAQRHPIAASTLGLVAAACLVMLGLRARARADEVAAAESEEAARRDARLAGDRAELARRAQAQVLRLSDARELARLVAESRELWPAVPDRVPALDAWIASAEELAEEAPDHERFLADLRDPESPTSRSLSPSEHAWWTGELASLVAGLESFVGAEGELEDVRRRRVDAAAIEQRSVIEHADAWDEAIAAIADAPLYEGLVLEPQMGLVPLGPDPFSELWEFWHVPSGAEPERDAEGLVTTGEETGVVLVLIPPGSFAMGSNGPLASPIEGPVHEVTLSAYFFAKFELTQGQWLRVMGENPSRIRPDFPYDTESVSLAHPVDSITWDMVSLFAFRQGLQLPTEAQWEYACRAWTDTPWSSGPEAEELIYFANVADRSAERHDPEIYDDCEAWDDGYAGHSPVGTFAPNGFGLHDVHGNVFEWVRDAFAFETYGESPELDPYRAPDDASHTYRVIRGGSFQTPSSFARSAARLFYDRRGTKSTSIGARLGRAIEVRDP